MVNLTSTFAEPSNLIGESETYLATLEQVSYLAKIDRPILIFGERGTGKELIAKRLHYLSPRWQRPFITLNCASLNENLLESELFGYEAGAFTGAQKRHMGRFERANNGTLFLDELTTAPSTVQEKLLRVIEYGEFERVGGSHTLQVNVRVLAATNENLPLLVQTGRFRADLLDRLVFDVITLPPLRQRQEDIMLLAEHFAQLLMEELALPVAIIFSQGAKQQLYSYSWPGNIRELKNVVERSIYRYYQVIDNASATSWIIEQIIFDPFPPEISQSSAQTTTEVINLPIDLKQQLQQQEIQWMQQALIKAQYNQRKAAQLLNITYHQWRGLLKKYALNFPVQ